MCAFSIINNTLKIFTTSVNFDIFKLFFLNGEYRKLIAKRRISERNLLIEKGRPLNIPRE